MEDIGERRKDGPLEMRIVRLEERVDAAKEALRLAAINIDRRLELMNELRNQINSERGDYLNRKEYETKHEVIRSAINSLQRFQWTTIGALATLQILLAALLHYLHF